ncbi:MAE_28990/MAE_18760 family HEPN-like nuclease [Salinimicrobium sp. TH3]|uniref:MAE_28990/MAE_18760 family HEPN-like nuclease n=1 Tax=Salinimicrobium sp. TH3 TaxID=2997342 RepID=UPI002273AF67|nr:MAE_28990/MAE_18760 family HEPN-like nuclease [Salinimicrobium sp. TH3]MCY2686004.1 MAE_28990/MAE_18760 family HEPN-like nuclease [Salinimicrobium sp. TH3]
MIVAIWAEIEEEFTWRIDELRILRNQIEQLNNEDSKRILRRSTLLMMYAHFEGFFKFSFHLYIKTINQKNLPCGEVNTHLLVSAFNDIFKDLRNPSSKSRIFSRALPDDGKLHSLARSVEFLDNLQLNLTRTVSIPESVVDTESNLKPVVLKKILFMLGLDYEMFSDEQSDINRLLSVRNKIAHGESRSGLEKSDFNKLYDLTFSLLRTIKTKIMSSITKEEFKKVP